MNQRLNDSEIATPAIGKFALAQAR